MRTQDEIVARIRERKDDDLFGFEWHELVERLDADHFMEFAADDADMSDWEPSSCDVDSVRKELEDYMEFAWDKANGCRGISASRSLAHMKAWLWLMSEAELLDRVEHGITYEYYGKPTLAAICEHLEIDWRQWDDGHWTSYEGEEGISADEALAAIAR